MLTLTPTVLGTPCCVMMLQVVCRMKKLIGGVKRIFSSVPSSRGSGSLSSDGSQDSAQSSSFVPSLHVTGVRSSILHTMTFLWPQTYESLRQREFGHTRVFDVNLVERVGMDDELPLILWTIGWGKLYGGDQMTQATEG
jgi:hypothetical protein